MAHAPVTKSTGDQLVTCAELNDFLAGQRAGVSWVFRSMRTVF